MFKESRGRFNNIVSRELRRNSNVCGKFFFFFFFPMAEILSVNLPLIFLGQSSLSLSQPTSESAVFGPISPGRP